MHRKPCRHGCIAPLGAWYADDPEQATHQAEISSYTTHQHREVTDLYSEANEVVFYDYFRFAHGSFHFLMLWLLEPEVHKAQQQVLIEQQQEGAEPDQAPA